MGKRTAILWLVVIGLSLPLMAQTADSSAQQSPPAAGGGEQASTSPAPVATSSPSPAVPDYCAGALDPYDAPAQRTAFLKAAGVDNELDENEFEADKQRGNGFARPFDSWAAMLKFDRNGSKTLDWFEADAYRQKLRSQLLAAFDTNKEGRLRSAQRDAANQALAQGWPAAQDRDGQWQAKQGDGSPAVPGAAPATGEADAQQRAAMRQSMRREAGLWREMLDQWNLRHFDVNGDGQLDDTERAAQAEFQKQLAGVIRHWSLRTSDLDGDGNVSADERRQARDEYRKAMPAMMIRISRYMDADGDGNISVAERDGFGEKLRAGIGKWIDKFSARFDADGDGRLDQAERTEMIKGLNEEIDARARKYDADGDGRLNPSETLNLMEDFIKEIGLEPVRPRQPATTPAPTTPPAGSEREAGP